MDFSKIDWALLTNYGGFVIGILGIWLSIYLYRISKSNKEPKCFYATFREIERFQESKSGIHVLFKDLEVERVYTTYIWIWNSGKIPILSSDIPKQSKLIFYLLDGDEQVTILDWRIAKTTRDEIKAKIKLVSIGSFTLDFDFLDQNDGIIVEIQHTGDLYTNVKFDGVILGANEGFKIIPHSSLQHGDEPPNRSFVRPNWSGKLMGLFVGVPWLIMLTKFAQDYLRDNPISKIEINTSTVVGILFFVGFFIGSLVWIVTPWTSPFPFPQQLEFEFKPDISFKKVFKNIYGEMLAQIRSRFFQ